MSTSENNPKMAAVPNRVEFFIRRFFERAGAAIDFALRRGGGGQPRTDLTTLAAQLERAVEENIRREKGETLSPNLFELRYDYETYMRMGPSRREFLERELSSNIFEYIYNRRYKISSEVQVRIAYDAFTRELEVRAGFGEGKAAVIPQNAPANEVAAKNTDVTLRGIGTMWELRATVSSNAEPAGIGRNVGNSLVIKDPTISNFHAALVIRSDGTLELADRASANGTYVNGVMLESGGKCIVRDGDRLRFGDVETILIVK